MSHRQAFHTSCRRGLSGHVGFQFNAASRDLDERQLARLAATHTGYSVPPDAPYEPDPEAIAHLPVSLRYLPVDGVGPVVSRTAYVGREFRGEGAEPDSGRFGNYFSHLVVGDGEAGEPFGGLMPIELWDAPHWTTTEAAETELPPLPRLEPGPLDLDRVLGKLRRDRADSLAAVADAALAAVLGGPRAAIVEPDPELAAAWVAWACFALPQDRAGDLTFSTFEGRPRLAEQLHLCVTTPACDTEFSPHELGSSVVVLDVESPVSVDRLSLYGRVLDVVAPQGAEAIAAVIRALPAGLDQAGAGAMLAVATGRTELAGSADVPGVVGVLTERLGEIPAATLAEQAAALPAEELSADAFAEWSRLYAAARESGDPNAGAVVDVALERMLGWLGDPPAELPRVPAESVATPSAGALAKWLDTVTKATGDGRLGPALKAGARLGLVGCNTALDKELVGPIAQAFADPAVQAAYGELADAGATRLVEGVALSLAAAAGAGRGLELLERAATQPIARAAVRANAARAEDFESVAAWELLRARSGAADRAGAVTALAARARTAAHKAAIRGLYGERGPTSPDEHAELLGGWLDAGGLPPDVDCDAALSCLARQSFWDGDGAARLFAALREGPRRLRQEPEYVAWSLRAEIPPETRAFLPWAEDVVRLRRASHGLSRTRAEELRRLAAGVAVRSMREEDHAAALELLVRHMGRGWSTELGDALADGAAKSLHPEKGIAAAFLAWREPRRAREELLEVALPRATRNQSSAKLGAVGEHLPKRLQRDWQEWLEEHPPRGAVSRRVRGVLGRGGDR